MTFTFNSMPQVTSILVSMKSSTHLQGEDNYPIIMQPLFISVSLNSLFISGGVRVWAFRLHINKHFCLIALSSFMSLGVRELTSFRSCDYEIYTDLAWHKIVISNQKI